MAANCWVAPTPMEGVAGVTTTAARTGFVFTALDELPLHEASRIIPTISTDNCINSDRVLHS